MSCLNIDYIFQYVNQIFSNSKKPTNGSGTQTTHRKRMVYMSLSYFIDFIFLSPAVYISALLIYTSVWNLQLIAAVLWSFRHTLSSPMWSQKSTWEYKQRNKGTGLDSFFSQQNLRVLKEILAALSDSFMFCGLESFAQQEGKPHFYLLLSCSETFSSNCPTSVCFCHC